MWDDIKCFVFAVEAGSFSAAAKKLGVSVATCSRRVDSLERELGVLLLRRETNGVSLTLHGERIYHTAASAATHLSQINRIAAALRDSVEAEPVLVSSTEPVIADILAPALPQLLRNNAEARVTLSVSTANVSISQRDADVAIRLARPTGDSLVIRRLQPIKLGLYASSGYLAGRNPASLTLSTEVLLGMDRSFGDIPEVHWFAEQGLTQQQQVTSSSVRALSYAAMAGCGIAMLPSFIANKAGLIPVPARDVPFRTPYLVFHKDFRKVKRVRLVRDWIAATFKQALQ